MEGKFKILNSKQGDIVISFYNSILKLSKLKSAIVNVILSNDLQELNNRLVSEGGGKVPGGRNSSDLINGGVNCEILEPGKTWQKGKFRMKVYLEFCPDEPEIEETTEIKEPESPLDDLRRMINDATS
jgi:hypothetical protein